MNEPLPVALVGCGFIADKAHANHFADAGLRLALAYDPQRARAVDLVSRFGTDGAQVADSFAACLEAQDIAAVILATPPRLHAEQVVAAVEADKHVLCEKPSALTVAENQAVLAAAEKAGRVVAFCSSRLRYGGYTAHARDAIAAGTLGELYRVEIRLARQWFRPGLDQLKEAHWFTDRSQAGGGVLYDMGQYLLDAVLWMLGWPTIETVCAQTRQLPHDLPPERVHDVEDYAHLFVRLRSGIVLTLDLHAATFDEPDHRITIQGTQGGLCLRHTEEGNTCAHMTEPSGEPGKLHESFLDEGRQPWGNKALYAAFTHAVRTGQRNVGTSPAEALTLTRLCSLAYQSVAEGRELPFLTN